MCLVPSPHALCVSALKPLLQSHSRTCSAELHQGCRELSSLLCPAQLRAWDGTVAAHISPWEGKVPAGSWEAGWWGWRPPASPQRAASRWALGCERLVMSWLWQQQEHGRARSGISTSIPPQRQRGGAVGKPVASCRRRPRCIIDTAGLTGIVCHGAGQSWSRGFWSSSSSQHLGDGG